jgi:hypothetical protein
LFQTYDSFPKMASSMEDQRRLDIRP